MKKIIYSIMLLLIIYLGLYIKGVFYLKKIYINDIEINIPKNMYLSSVSTDGINLQNMFSSLPFIKQIDQYEFPKYKMYTFLFTSINSNESTDVFMIKLQPRIKNKISFQKFMLKNLQEKEYQEVDTQECFVYFTKKNTFNAFIFYKKEKISIDIYASNVQLLYNNLHLFCTDFARSKGITPLS